MFKSLANVLQRPEVGLFERMQPLAYHIRSLSSTFHSALGLSASLDRYQNLCISCSNGRSRMAEFKRVGILSHLSCGPNCI